MGVKRLKAEPMTAIFWVDSHAYNIVLTHTLKTLKNYEK